MWKEIQMHKYFVSPMKRVMACHMRGVFEGVNVMQALLL